LIDLYRREWRPGEFLAGETLLFLAKLHGQRIPELPQLRREHRHELQREKKHLTAMRRSLEQGVPGDTVSWGFYLKHLYRQEQH
jgi:hypothetical protein